MIQQSIGNNTEWKNGYKEGFADGYAAAKKELNYRNYPPVYWGTPNYGADWNKPYCGTPTGGLSYSMNASNNHFVTGLSVSSSDC